MEKNEFKKTTTLLFVKSVTVAKTFYMFFDKIINEIKNSFCHKETINSSLLLFSSHNCIDIFMYLYIHTWLKISNYLNTLYISIRK